METGFASTLLWACSTFCTGWELATLGVMKQVNLASQVALDFSVVIYSGHGSAKAQALFFIDSAVGLETYTPSPDSKKS